MLAILSPLPPPAVKANHAVRSATSAKQEFSGLDTPAAWQGDNCSMTSVSNSPSLLFLRLAELGLLLRMNSSQRQEDLDAKLQNLAIFWLRLL